MASPGLTAPLLPDGAASPATPFPAIPTWTPPTSAERERDRRREEAIDRELAELEAERLRGLFELGRDLDLGGSDGGAGDLVATRAGARARDNSPSETKSDWVERAAALEHGLTMRLVETRTETGYGEDDEAHFPIVARTPSSSGVDAPVATVVEPDAATRAMDEEIEKVRKELAAARASSATLLRENEDLKAKLRAAAARADAQATLARGSPSAAVKEALASRAIAEARAIRANADAMAGVAS